jgi:hypothetical protein
MSSIPSITSPAEQVLAKGADQVRHGQPRALRQRHHHGDDFAVGIGADRGVDAAVGQLGIVDDVVDHVGRKPVLDHLKELCEHDAFHGGLLQVKRWRLTPAPGESDLCLLRQSAVQLKGNRARATRAQHLRPGAVDACLFGR